MKTIIRSPMKYIQGNGVLDELCQEVKFLGKKGAYAVIGNSAMNKYQARIEDSFKRGGFGLKLRKFGGECSQQEVDAILADLKANECDIVMGIGGGKTLDTAKAVAYHAGIPVAIVPTAASSDAPCSALSVLYHPDGRFDRYLMLKNNPEVVLMDSGVIADAPARLFIAGMGDALATFFEARACHMSRATSIAGGVCSETALALARTCLNILMANGPRAALGIQRGCVTRAVENVMEANTYLSGVGFESGGLAAAHAIHNGMTVLEETHAMLHGEKVAFGVLVHLVLENAPGDELNDVIGFCRAVGLPVCLPQLGVKELTRDKVMAVAKASCAEGETIHNMPFKVAPEDVTSAIIVANEMGMAATGMQ